MFRKNHCVIYRNFTLFPCAEILLKRTVSAEFQTNHLKLYLNCTFPQNFRIRKLGKIWLIYAVNIEGSSKTMNVIYWSVVLYEE